MKIIGGVYFYSECVGGYINGLIRRTRKENAINLFPLSYLIIGFYLSLRGVLAYLIGHDNALK